MGRKRLNTITFPHTKNDTNVIRKMMEKTEIEVDVLREEIMTR